MSFLLFVFGVIAYISLASRIKNLEAVVRRQESPVSASPASAPQPAPAPAAITASVAPPSDGSVRIGDAPHQAAWSAPVIDAVSAKPAVQVVAEDFEAKLGGKVFTGIGVTALILAAAFFFQYAFKNGWITEGMLVATGGIVGTLLMGIGEFFVRKYPNYGNMLSGGGIGILFLSFFAGGPNVYHLYPSIVTLLGVGLVSVIGAILAVRHASFPLAAFALVGGFIAPLMLAPAETDPNLIFPYLLFMDLFALWIEHRTLWRTTSIVAFLGTALVSTTWVITYFNSTQLMVGELYATILFAVFFVVMLLPRISHSETYDERDGFLAVGNGGWYFGISYLMMATLTAQARGLFAACLGAVYGATAIVMRTGNDRAKKVMELCLALSFVFFSVAIWAIWDGSMITVLWAALATAFSLLALALRAPALLMLGQALFGVSLIRYLTFGLSVSAPAMAFFNTRIGTCAALVFFALVNAIAYRMRQRKNESSLKQSVLPSLFLLEGYAALFFAATVEIQQFYTDNALMIMWGLIGFVALLGGLLLRDQPLRVAGYLTMGFMALRLFFNHAGTPVGYEPFFNERVGLFLFGALLIGAAALTIRFAERMLSDSERQGMLAGAFFIANALLLYVVSAETLDYFDHQTSVQGVAYQNVQNAKQVALSVAWTVYGMILLVIGIITRSSRARQASLALIAVVIIKVFFFDAASLSTLYRFFSFAALGVLLVLAGYLYNRYRDRITEFLHSGNTSFLEHGERV